MLIRAHHDYVVRFSGRSLTSLSYHRLGLTTLNGYSLQHLGRLKFSDQEKFTIRREASTRPCDLSTFKSHGLDSGQRPDIDVPFTYRIESRKRDRLPITRNLRADQNGTRRTSHDHFASPKGDR